VFPNGVVITPDARNMLLAESFAFRITAFGLDPDRRLTGRREWARFAPGPASTMSQVLVSDTVVPDGLVSPSTRAEHCGWRTPRIATPAESSRAAGRPPGDLSVYALTLGVTIAARCTCAPRRR
jgi:hypothetical protein